MINFSKYLGIPYLKDGRDRSGLDCYGLMKIISEDNNENLPEYFSEDEESVVSKIIADQDVSFIKLDRPESGCYVVFSLQKGHIHIGRVLDDCKRFIHILEKRNVTIEKLDNWLWSKKIVGYYLWKK